MPLELEDIIFFLLLGFALFIILWLLHGSPILDSAVMAIGMALITSEMFLWRKLFSMDKKTVVSFVKVHYELT